MLSQFILCIPAFTICYCYFRCCVLFNVICQVILGSGNFHIVRSNLIRWGRGEAGQSCGKSWFCWMEQLAKGGSRSRPPDPQLLTGRLLSVLRGQPRSQGLLTGEDCPSWVCTCGCLALLLCPFLPDPCRPACQLESLFFPASQGARPA